MIITASSEITAVPEKPSNNWSTGIRSVTPIATSTSSAIRSGRIHSSTSMATVKTSRPNTMIISGVSVSPLASTVSMSARIDQCGQCSNASFDTIAMERVDDHRFDSCR